MAKAPESLHESLHEPLRQGPDWDHMTDAEIMAFMAAEGQADKYAVAHLEPDGMTYQWGRYEVWGQLDNNRIAEMEQKGWRAVPLSRHPAEFRSSDKFGNILLDGCMLMELPKRVVRLKRELASRVAQEKVHDMNAQLVYAPPGTGPRGTHAYTAPVVKRESGSMPMVVE